METIDALLKADERAIFVLRGLYRRYGYRPYRLRGFEEYDFYQRSRDFLGSGQLVTFSAPDGRLMALRPDVTLSVIKNAPDSPGEVRKFYYNEHIFRSGRDGLVHERSQTGIECVGDLGSYELAEVVTLAAQSLAALGGDYVLNLSHVGLIAAVLEEAGVTDRDAAVHCLHRKSVHALRQLGADGKAQRKLELLTTLSGEPDVVLAQLAPALDSPAARAALEELEMLCGILKRGGCGRAHIDFSVGNDMKYYSGVVFRGYLAGVPTGILSGGQYDALLQNMGRRGHAIGFALNLDALARHESPPTPPDTLIVHDGRADPAVLAAAAAEAAESGSVLVTSGSVPADFRGRVRRIGREG